MDGLSATGQWPETTFEEMRIGMAVKDPNSLPPDATNRIHSHDL